VRRLAQAEQMKLAVYGPMVVAESGTATLQALISAAR
jgi:hypothetical protein